jgi:hypothetical protein
VGFISNIPQYCVCSNTNSVDSWHYICSNKLNPVGISTLVGYLSASPSEDTLCAKIASENLLVLFLYLLILLEFNGRMK